MLTTAVARWPDLGPTLRLGWTRPHSQARKSMGRIILGRRVGAEGLWGRREAEEGGRGVGEGGFRWEEVGARAVRRRNGVPFLYYEQQANLLLSGLLDAFSSSGTKVCSSSGGGGSAQRLERAGTDYACLRAAQHLHKYSKSLGGRQAPALANARTD